MLRRNFFVSWYEKQGRSFPWRDKGTSPFAFLITEMLLRQTRAQAVAKIWPALMKKYPTAEAMANALKDDLYGRLRILGFGDMRSSALIAAARWLVTHNKGKVPTNFEQLLEIPHVGTYAANAVLCFAFGYKVEIVDNNVQRFFARYYNLEVKADIRRNPHVTELARQALPRETRKAKYHNYGLLDFTAQICKPVRPLCEVCPLASSCALGTRRLSLPTISAVNPR